MPEFGSELSPWPSDPSRCGPRAVRRHDGCGYAREVLLVNPTLQLGGHLVGTLGGQCSGRCRRPRERRTRRRRCPLGRAVEGVEDSDALPEPEQAVSARIHDQGHTDSEPCPPWQPPEGASSAYRQDDLRVSVHPARSSVHGQVG